MCTLWCLGAGGRWTGNGSRLPSWTSAWRSLAQLIKRTYEVEPLVCPSCGGEMQVIAFIIEHEVVDAILRHLKRKEERRERAPLS